ncbi:MAG TPA: hydrogenase 4 subunit B [bacterium]|nr:hydrogenase 4 subunit B [bacterium]
MGLAALLGTVAALLALGILVLPLAHRRPASPLVYGTTLMLCGIALVIATRHLLTRGASAEDLVLPLGIPWLGAHFRLDALAAFFLLVVNLGGVSASLFSLGYGRHESAPGRVLPFYAAFLAGMNLVVLAADAFTFLLAWEFMSLSSWALVMAHHKEPGTAHAGFVYLAMASFGTLCLLLAFGLLAGPQGAYAFDQMRAHPPGPVIAGLALLLAVLGAGSKAGLVPLHPWLPLAHPAAPSQVSALMSGVMTKVALYGFVRIVFDLLGPPEWWWSVPVLVLGGLSAVLGVLNALMQNDLKRLLAYSTVENVGIIAIGLGLSLAFRATGIGWAASLALTAALFHVLNHSLFKSLLFFGSGAVMMATDERDMDRLGGLIHPMPLTAFAFLVGAAAISALPPLNGFASEWLTFQSILVSPQLPQWGLRFLVPAVGAILALSAALAAACFVKAFGITFLGRPRSARAQGASEVDAFALAAMFGLAALCLAAGLMPGVVVDALAPVTQALTGAHVPVQRGLAWLSLVPIAESRSAYNGLVLFTFIALSTLATVVAIHRLASHAVRRGPAWDCGFPDASPATQYSAGSFGQPIRRTFGTIIFAAREHITMPLPGDPAPARLELQLRDFIWNWLYQPLGGLVGRVADLLNHLQFLTIRKYLSLVFGVLIVLLLLLAVWR